jgi:hypothetical protein
VAGAYNSIVNIISKEVFTFWKEELTQENLKGTSHFRKDYEIYDRKKRLLEFTLEGLIQTRPRLRYAFEGETYPGNEEECSHIGIVFNVSSKELRKRYSTISIDLKDIIRHEIEHLTQSGWNKRKGKDFQDESIVRYLINELKEVPYSEYFLLGKEVDAMLQGLYFKAKKQRRSFREVILEDLSRFNLNKKEIRTILQHWEQRIKALSLPSIL